MELKRELEEYFATIGTRHVCVPRSWGRGDRRRVVDVTIAAKKELGAEDKRPTQVHKQERARVGWNTFPSRETSYARRKGPAEESDFAELQSGSVTL
jgi:hypothetical protein